MISDSETVKPASRKLGRFLLISVRSVQNKSRALSIMLQPFYYAGSLRFVESAHSAVPYRVRAITHFVVAPVIVLLI